MNSSQDRGVAEAIHVTEATIDEALVASEGLVMVDFWADWCAPCRAIAPVLDELVQAFPGRLTLLKVNVDESPALAVRYEIRSIPTILFFKDGAIVERVVGAAPKVVLESIVNARG